MCAEIYSRLDKVGNILERWRNVGLAIVSRNNRKGTLSRKLIIMTVDATIELDQGLEAH